MTVRVLHVAEAFGGGVFEMVSTLSVEISNRGYPTAIAYGVRPETPDMLHEKLADDVELHELNWGQRNLRSNLSALSALRQLAGNWKPDVIHLHSSFAGAVGAVSVAGRYPTIYSPHGYAFERPHSRYVSTGIRTVERLVSRRVAMVGAVSEHEGTLARERLSAPRVAVVPNGIPELNGPVEGRAVQCDETRVVASGRPVPQRQPEEVALMLDQLRPAASVLWIGGGYADGPGAAALSSYQIPTTGWLPRAEALAQLATASVYLHWTRWDGLALGILEAMALDVVVVASDIPVNREVLGDRQVCASPREAVSLIRAVLSTSSVKDELLASQRARRANYGSAKMADGWINLYESLKQSGKPDAHTQPMECGPKW